MDSFTSCGNCQNGYKIFHRDGVGYAFPCKCLREYKRDKLRELKTLKTGISSVDAYFNIEEYIGKDKNQNIPKIKNFVAKFKEKYNHINLYIWSHENSTQKSTIAKWIGTELSLQGLDVQFILMDELVKLLLNQFDEEAQNRVQMLSSIDCLIIDDAFDPKKVTLYKSGYQFTFIDSFLRKRMEVSRKSTIFTSNIAPEEIGGIYTKDLEKMIRRNLIEDFHFTDIISEGEMVEKIDLNTFWEL